MAPVLMESILQKVVQNLLDKFQASYSCVTVMEENEHYRVTIDTDEPSRLIGANGVILNSLQYIVKTILWTKYKENVFFSLDVDGYQKQQEEKIITQAKKSIQFLEDNNLSEVKMLPMSSFARRMIHVWIAANRSEFMTESISAKNGRAVKIYRK